MITKFMVLRPRLILEGLAIGLAAGFIMGFMFKGVEAWTDIQVYVLLLNVDFIPGLQQTLPEWFEFTLHLLVSLVIGVMYRWSIAYWPKPWLFALIAGLLPVPLFIPLTILSERTPQITDNQALFWWVLGHLLYGFILAIFGMWVTRKTKL